ncbi:hypothetical protein I552_5369 [Mycobacterium xenopi 3993]|nr:hypothetical protein I552_5369 [Mycobacterium xenopi 3993]
MLGVSSTTTMMMCRTLCWNVPRFGSVTSVTSATPLVGAHVGGAPQCKPRNRFVGYTPVVGGYVHIIAEL